MCYAMQTSNGLCTNHKVDLFYRAFKYENAILIYMFPYLTHPLNNISFCGSIFTTVALAYERYCAVCKPLNYRNATTRYSVRTRTLW